MRREIEYVVVKGDTLWGIGRRHKVSWERLAQYNKLKNPDLIVPGQKIRIPLRISLVRWIAWIMKGRV